MTTSSPFLNVPRLILFAAICWIVPMPSMAQEPIRPSETSAEGTVQALYDLVTFPECMTPDWDAGRALFIPEAVIVLRSSREEFSTFTVEGWIQDFVDFIEARDVASTGFTERIVRTHAVEFGDVAHVWVLYEAEIPGWGRPPQQAVDGFQLVRKEGRWLIASIMNEVPGPNRPLPPVLRGEGP